MRSRLVFVLAVVILAGTSLPALCDNYLKNADFKEGSQLWRGDGQAAFLKPDGTEGSETDPGAVPVLRISLSKSQARSVYQEVHIKDAPRTLNLKVQVYASVDFQRSKRAGDYQGDEYIPITDFIVRFSYDYSYSSSTFDLKPGHWTTVKSPWPNSSAGETRTITFMVPPGDGVIYLKAASLTP